MTIAPVKVWMKAGHDIAKYIGNFRTTANIIRPSCVRIIIVK